jgi:LmbE family N-acetylglucosaminyl deacetylase|tara:strand:+ start:1143 stop:1769 length:627 start_codon:yes stop_codon:yes gene_type:complete
MNVLAVGAHFDDIEMGCSGTLIKHVQNRDKVTMLVITNSGYKDPNGIEVRNTDTASKEGQMAAKIIGADLVCLDYETFFIPFDDNVTKTIISYIQNLSIDTIYIPWVHDIHRDHQYAAKNVLMAARHVPRILMYRCNYYDSEHSFRGNFYSDISGLFDKKTEVIKANKTELQRVRYDWLKFIRNQHENDGLRVGVKYAECFEVVRYLI